MNRKQLTLSVVVLFALVVSACAPILVSQPQTPAEGFPTAAIATVPETESGEPLEVKVLTVAMFEVGESTGDFPGEVQLWVEGEEMTQEYDVTGAFSPVYCNKAGFCAMVTGMGTANAAASLMAVGLDPQFDLTKTYIMVAGIAGTPPDDGTLGAAAWAEWVVDGDLAHEIDSREIPESWDYPLFRLGCAEPWCDGGWSSGTDVFHLNADLAEWSYQLSKDVELFDSEGAPDYRANYPEGLPARQTPFVTKCDSFAASTYWHGALLSDWAEWWTDQLTDGQGNYCMSNMEDSGTLTSLSRLSDAGLLDLDRVAVLRTASNFDQQYPGQTAAESVRAENDGFMPSVQNAYRVGSAAAQHIVDNWEEWKDGVPSLP
ncbi:MAG: purine nucleoside permease [Chloroflexota bacterium]|nr:purine nucleoside permease [Chloroflexota bacterium]